LPSQLYGLARSPNLIAARHVAELPLHERDKENVRAAAWPASRYDDPAAPRIAAPE
jgi:hypothetical protein